MVHTKILRHNVRDMFNDLNMLNLLWRSCQVLQSLHLLTLFIIDSCFLGIPQAVAER